MKSCNSFKDLEQFGIKPLTGEADALGYRILCDLTELGCKVFKECCGMPCAPSQAVLGLAENWNSGAVASIMLTGFDIVPLAIMGFYLKGYDVVLTTGKSGENCVFALEHDETLEYDPEQELYLFSSGKHDPPWPAQAWPSVYGEIVHIIKQRKSDGQVVQGTRNVHQMSGRSS